MRVARIGPGSKYAILLSDMELVWMCQVIGAAVDHIHPSWGIDTKIEMKEFTIRLANGLFHAYLNPNQVPGVQLRDDHPLCPIPRDTPLTRIEDETKQLEDLCLRGRKPSATVAPACKQSSKPTGEKKKPRKRSTSKSTRTPT